MDDVVSLVNVRASYEGERHATLAGVTFSLSAREQLAITGPNGAGKTTVLEVVNGLLPITSGTVRALGQPVTPASHRLRAQIAYVPQNLFFSPDTPFLVRDVVLAARFGKARGWSLSMAEDRRHVDRALEAVGIAALERRPVGRLSGGQQRKTLLARSLAQEARLLLLDEPTANLDPEAKQEVADLVALVRHNLGAAAIVVSHESGPLLEASDRAVRIELGRIVDGFEAVRVPAVSH
ncbi:metal ABC transporter ATP-binding protein [Candidatus Bipolaricaulota bacterium]